MIDLRPIFYVVGRVLVVLAILMLAPAVIDARAGLHNGADFLQSAIITGAVGLMLSVATSNALGLGLSARQAYLMTAAIWGFVPLFGALPFMLGEPHLSFTDAYFEAVSGITTTGSTVIVGLDTLPPGMNLWRGMLNSLGGLGIAFVAMIFLPVLRVGGMQYFRTEGFDTFGKALPRATDIARQLVIVYFGLTLVCMAAYRMVGMEPLDAAVNAMATIATGGFSPTDISFTKYQGLPEYIGGTFMVLASFPYIRFVQMLNGSLSAPLIDRQVRGYVKIIAVSVGMVTVWQVLRSDMPLEAAFRESYFNLASIISGTGFFSGSFGGWGGFSMAVALVLGVIGGCSGSSSGALTVFRVQVLMATLLTQIKLIGTPSRVLTVRYDGRAIEQDVTGALILYVTSYILIIGVMTVALSLLGSDPVSALFAIWTSIGNIGYGYGAMVARTGTFVDFNDASKWVMIVTMIMGRLGLLTILLLVLLRFWRD
ncbi:TrkH family potassium uptake protein [Tabrizicola oligotrophica]|uniref:Trk system potassium uptake protein n=1 Tax=Tabrizicola oligotrophica TaxID=2710650 RepID=A0A6M0QUJ4_9RHOB|nr:TrkH family potassium uptake protein [Tabrizicola oligotrophica]NEY90671.1 TrkH family potassium uptake protein [Tabrizicola oligotrophica]